jgi:hypothetical protein
MKNPIVWMVVAVILILIGTGLFVYSGTCVTVEKNGKKRSVVHWVYIAIGIIFILISIWILFLLAKDLKNIQKVPEGMILASVPENFGVWVGENSKNNAIFTKVVGNYINNNIGNIKKIKDGYKAYKNN